MRDAASALAAEHALEHVRPRLRRVPPRPRPGSRSRRCSGCPRLRRGRPRPIRRRGRPARAGSAGPRGSRGSTRRRRDVARRPGSFRATPRRVGRQVEIALPHRVAIRVRTALEVLALGPHRHATMLRRDAISHRAGRAIPPIRMLQNDDGGGRGIATGQSSTARSNGGTNDPNRRTHRHERVTDDPRRRRIGGRCCAKWRSVAPAPRSARCALGKTAEAADDDPCYSATPSSWRDQHQHDADDHSMHTPATARDRRARARSASAARPCRRRHAVPGRRSVATADADVAERRARLDDRSRRLRRRRRQPARRPRPHRARTQGLAVASTTGADQFLRCRRGRARRRAPTSPASSTSTRTARCGSRCPHRTTAAPTRAIRQARRHAGERSVPLDRSPARLRLP